MLFWVECILFLLLWKILQGQMWMWGYLSTAGMNHFSLIFLAANVMGSTYGSFASLNVNLQHKDDQAREDKFL